MPLSRISLRAGKSPSYKSAIVRGLYDAMREAYDVPEGDLFMTISEHEAQDFHYGPDYLGIARSDDLVIVQLTVSNTRGLEKKKALYRAIVRNLTTAPGLRPEDVFINLVEVLPENWSFGHGLAQYVSDP